jgi:hypothetical protein
VPAPDQELVLSGGHLTPVAITAGSAGALPSVVVELLPPRDADHRRAPEWAGAAQTAPVEGLWRATIRASAVDELLAWAIHDGWSVHRVDPGQAHEPQSSGPQSSGPQ